MNFKLGKRGDSEEIAWPEIVFIVLVLAVAALLLIFAKNTLSGALVQEELYAKKIALILTGAEPSTELLFDISKLEEIASKSGVKKEYFKDIIKINNETSLVTVSLRLGKGFSYPYFSNYSVIGSYEPSTKETNYRIVIRRKNE